MPDLKLPTHANRTCFIRPGPRSDLHFRLHQQHVQAEAFSACRSNRVQFCFARGKRKCRLASDYYSVLRQQTTANTSSCLRIVSQNTTLGSAVVGTTRSVAFFVKCSNVPERFSRRRSRRVGAGNCATNFVDCVLHVWSPVAAV